MIDEFYDDSESGGIFYDNFESDGILYDDFESDGNLYDAEIYNTLPIDNVSRDNTMNDNKAFNDALAKFTE